MEERKIVEVVTGTNVKLLKSLPAGEKNNALEVVVFVYDNGDAELVQYNANKESRKEFVTEMMSLLKARQIRNNQITKLDVKDKRIRNYIKNAVSVDDEIVDEMGVNNIVYDPSQNKKDHSLVKKGVIGLAIIGLAGALTYCGAQHLLDKETDDLDNTNSIEEETGYGFYKYDLSKMEDMSEYDSLVVDSEQKQGALNRLNILRNFNNEITLVDKETKQLTGLTIEQLVAVDAYANSNIYEREDYIKNFGLYDFSSVTDDFQQAVLVTGASLANKDFDGTAMADIFKDKAVKANYLKQLEYRDKILNAESSKEQKQFVNEYVEFLRNCSINQASSEYLDYDQHPGMAFVTSSVVNALNYHNIVLSKEVVSDIIIIGDEDSQSKINSICADAYAKIEAATEFVDIMERALVLNESNIVYNQNETIKAQSEGRQPQLLSLQYEELDKLIRESLCDQEQINELTNKTLEKENKLVTVEDQKVVLANAVNIQVELLNTGKGGYYKDEKTAQLAQQLVKPGDKVVEVQKDVHFDTDEEIAKIESAAPEQTKEAREELNEKEGLIDNSNEEAKKDAEETIQDIIEETAKEGVDNYQAVVDYYRENGNVSGIPDELKDELADLGQDIFDMAQQTGVAQNKTNEENKYSGGEVNITIDKDVEVKDVSNIAVYNSSVSKEESNKEEEKTEETVQTPSQPSVDNNEVSTPTVPETPKTEETVQTPSQPSVDNNEVSTPTVPENNNSSTQIGGEIIIDSMFDGIDISDISTDPYSYDIDSYSLESIYGVDEYTSTEEVGKTR